MMKSKEFKISTVLSIVALILFGVSMVTGLMPIAERVYSIDKISLYLGFALLGFSHLFLQKSKINNALQNKEGRRFFE